MFSLFSIITTLALGLAIVTAEPVADTANQLLQTRQSRNGNNNWRVNNPYIGCSQNFCSYEFDIESDETYDLPGFSAHCYRQVGLRDSSYNLCDIRNVYNNQNPGKNLNGIYASVSLDPSNRQNSQFYVAAQVSYPR